MQENVEIMDYFDFLIGGFLYLVSEKFRQKKNKEWSEKSQLYKIYEIGSGYLCRFLEY